MHGVKDKGQNGKGGTRSSKADVSGSAVGGLTNRALYKM